MIESAGVQESPTTIACGPQNAEAFVAYRVTLYHTVAIEPPSLVWRDDNTPRQDAGGAFDTP